MEEVVKIPYIDYYEISVPHFAKYIKSILEKDEIDPEAWYYEIADNIEYYLQKYLTDNSGNDIDFSEDISENALDLLISNVSDYLEIE